MGSVSVSTTLGRLSEGKDFAIDLAEPWHVAVQGMTRSGKSVLLYGLLGGLANRRDALICGCDPSGILLNPWRGHPRDELRSIGTGDVAAHLAVLTELLAIMDGRIAQLLAEDRDKVPSPSAEQQLLIVVLEEYPGLLSAAEADDEAHGRKPADRVAPKLKRAVRRLVQEGAKAGLRVVLVAQRMDAAIVGGAERASFGTRISMRVDNGDAVRMLHPNADADLVDVVGRFSPGVGLVARPGSSDAIFKTDLLSYGDYVRVVRGWS